MSQTTSIGLGRTSQSRISGYPLGKTRTGSFNALAGVAWGSNLQVGRVVLYSPEYIRQLATGAQRPIRSFALPDLAGDYIADPSTGDLLSTNAALLADFEDANGNNLVAGVVIEGDRCDDTRCDRPQPWPIGDSDNLYEWNFAQNRRPATVGIRGYFGVRLGTDVNVGDNLAVSTITDSADPTVGVRALGSVVVAGTANSIALPANWDVINPGKAGESAEIYIR